MFTRGSHILAQSLRQTGNHSQGASSGKFPELPACSDERRAKDKPGRNDDGEVNGARDVFAWARYDPQGVGDGRYQHTDSSSNQAGHDPSISLIRRHMVNR